MPQKTSRCNALYGPERREEVSEGGSFSFMRMPDRDKSRIRCGDYFARARGH